MGILNITPDSFSDGGRFFKKDNAIKQAMKMAEDGADIIDIGGESTRPGAVDVGIDEEMRRVVPVIGYLAKRVKIPISVDTRKYEVAESAISAGASIINDVSGLAHDPRIGRLAADSKAGLILMHMKGSPRDMQKNPSYKNLVGEIIRSLKLSVNKARRLGVGEESIAVDPGIGFGKSCIHNLFIINRLKEFAVLDKPICVGLSRKSFIGMILGLRSPEDRLAGTIAANALAVMNGASILRVHDV
ncbi:MAG TPA: dihydropteroate synthase, partial [Candidatus Omnitrophota bacterium]|nr:dihydropteroate synthase [Candidatus Omnitrophota bacterium]